MPEETKKKRVAPDRISDVADWGDRPIHGKDVKDMTAEELDAAEKAAAKLPPLPHTQDRP